MMISFLLIPIRKLPFVRDIYGIREYELDAYDWIKSFVFIFFLFPIVSLNKMIVPYIIDGGILCNW